MSTELWGYILTSSLVASLITQFISFIKGFFHSKKIDRMVLFFIIKTIATDAIWAGHISTEDLQFLEECYSEYKRLGGNGFADTLMNRVRVLPIKEDE